MNENQNLPITHQKQFSMSQLKKHLFFTNCNKKVQTHFSKIDLNCFQFFIVDYFPTVKNLKDFKKSVFTILMNEKVLTKIKVYIKSQLAFE